MHSLNIYTLFRRLRPVLPVAVLLLACGLAALVLSSCRTSQPPSANTPAAPLYLDGIPTVRVTRVRESDDPFLEVTAASATDLRAVRMVLILPKWAPAKPAEASR